MALRVKRLKRIKKILEFHRINFDMRPPFNIIGMNSFYSPLILFFLITLNVFHFFALFS